MLCIMWYIVCHVGGVILCDMWCVVPIVFLYLYSIWRAVYLCGI